jgi:hypothetical protein
VLADATRCSLLDQLLIAGSDRLALDNTTSAVALLGYTQRALFRDTMRSEPGCIGRIFAAFHRVPNRQDPSRSASTCFNAKLRAIHRALVGKPVPSPSGIQADAAAQARFGNRELSARGCRQCGSTDNNRRHAACTLNS